MLDFIKKHRIIFIISIILSPAVIYLLLFLPIPTNASTDGDWLSFWGSFLGGLFGGGATLVAVLLTIEEMNRDKSDRKKQEEAVIIPVKSQYQINDVHDEKNYKFKYTIRNYKDQSFHDKINEYIGKEEFEKALQLSNELGPSFEVLNISDNIAVNVSIKWKKPSIKEINGVLFESNKVTFEEYEKIDEGKPNEIQLLKAESSCEDIYLCYEIQKFIGIILDKYNECSKLEDYKNLDFPVGRFEITNTNIYGKEHKDDINISMRIIASALNQYYSFYLNYNIIDINKES